MEGWKEGSVLEFYHWTNEIESKKKKGEGGGDKRIWIDRCFDWDKLEGVIFSERFHFLSIRDGENFSRGTMAICSRGEV